jgi:hypothetical protein
MYSSTLSLTSVLDGVDGQRHAPAALPQRTTGYPLYRRVDGFQGRSRRVRKISPPLGFDPRTVQPVASRYTDSVLIGKESIRLISESHSLVAQPVAWSLHLQRYLVVKTLITSSFCADFKYKCPNDALAKACIKHLECFAL